MQQQTIRRAAAAALLCLLGAVPAVAQLSPNMQDILRRINAGEFGGARSAGPGGQWVDGGRGYLASERTPGGASEIARYDTATGKRSVLLAAAQLTPPQLGKPLQFTRYEFSTDGRRVLFATNGRLTAIRKMASDYWVLDTTDGSWYRLGGKASTGLLYAKLSPDGTRVAYVRDNDLCVEDIRSGAISPLTSDGGPTLINGTSDYVYEEEFYLSDAFEWSPDGKRIAYFQFDLTGVPEFALVNYTDTLYPVITRFAFPKPGQTNSAVRVGVVDASGGPTRWMKTPGDPRDTYIARAGWASSSRELILQHLNRQQNRNDILLADVETGDVRRMYRVEDPAWVDINRTYTWLEEGKRLLFVSEHDGWRHAYAVSRNGDARLITTEPFDLISVSGVDEKGGWLYYIASPQNATQRYLYRSPLDGSGGAERVTPAESAGTHTYQLSPDCRWAFHGHSTFEVPTTSDLVSLPDHQVVRVFQDNAALRAKVAPMLAGRTEFIQVEVDGVRLDGWLIRPTAFDPSKRYPVIVNVYGEPAATTVNDSWGGAGRVLSAALADDGYLIASFDNRGTPAPKGRAWRKVIHGAIGVLSSKEQAGALRALAASRPYVDLTRVGVHGWSGGGSMTLNLLFRHPELYKVGVAGAAVPDQLLYNSIYQERYVGLPDDNPEGYRVGSPINFAEGLQGKLLIIHGTGDDNVHYQGTERLVNRLIDLNKQFSFMAYPNRRHGISGIHLDTLRYGFLEEHLPAGGR
ncbi:MAG TPA: DPP IV N-terminal domain-containing protein [Vicinamibacterales bacterium]|nr:DPP IV N-terminal domain-containing protein [Vicinamibacterales bacterium]